MFIFDIETTGLDPSACSVRCYAALDTETGDAEVKISAGGEGEKRLLSGLVAMLEPYQTLCGWNIEEFDYWFVSERCRKHGIAFPELIDIGKAGKYGKPRYTVDGFASYDLAYELQTQAEELGIEHRLQSLAQAYGWRPSTELDGAQMPGAVPAAVAAHCLDDIDACRFLADSVGREASFAETQADWLEGNLG